MIIAIYIITFMYCLLILWFIIGFDKVAPYSASINSYKTRFSVIVPFRNEAEFLPHLLATILKLEYNRDFVEFIFVNDASDDDSIEIIKTQLANQGIDFRIIDNQRITKSPKKDAITLAISNSKYDWIITTDADCSLPINWLIYFDSAIQEKHPKMIVAPVTYYDSNSFLSQFQLLDLLSLQSITVGGFGIGRPFLCNGANLAYSKQLFYSVEGFVGNSDISSGDDIFILEKVSRLFPKSIFYLKSLKVLVQTHPMQSSKELFQQRLRWASKTYAQKGYFVKLVGLLVLLMNLALILTVVLTVLNSINIMTLFYVLILKLAIDFCCIYKMARFTEQLNVLKTFVLSSLIYPVFLVSIVVLMPFSSFEWKGRSYRK